MSPAPKIAIVDYGVGNLRSVEKALAAVGARAAITSNPDDVAAAGAVVLPGVGAFGAAAANLRQSGLLPLVLESIAAGKPFLGICVGMQLLYEYSEELYGGKIARGLGLLPGAVRLFPPGLKTPQIGWNQLELRQESPLFKGIDGGSYVYFVHSYYCDPADKQDTAAETEYGITYCSSVIHKNIAAIQFHPEKSSVVGLAILRNFWRWCRDEWQEEAAHAR